jgi:tetratricopeptide (TPR) repeat protein
MRDNMAVLLVPIGYGVRIMKISVLAVILGAAASVFCQTRGTLAPDLLYARSKISSVTIWTFDANRAPLGQGSGFIVAKNRVATNYHVLAGSSTASITFDDGSVAAVKSVIAASGPKDLMIVEIETGNRPVLPLGDELQLKVGDPVYAIGTPKGLSASLSSGLVSAFRQDEGQFLIQITALIAPGSSGGPLLNNQGQVVGITTSRLKDGSFGFATGVGDLQHLLKVPLSLKLELSYFGAEETTAPANNEIVSVQSLYDQKKYEEALNGFSVLTERTKNSFDGQFLLCKIEQQSKHYRDSIQACNAAISSRPNESWPYGMNAYSLWAVGDLELAEASATKAIGLSNDVYFKNLLGIIHYSEEKYELVSKDLASDSNDAFVLSLLIGADFHNRNFDDFRRLLTKVTSIKGEDNGWALFRNGLAAESDLNWNLAAEKYRKCDADDNFIDAICVVSLARVETSQANFDSAKQHIDSALAHYPKNHDVLVEAIFLYLLVGDSVGAERLHGVLKSVVVNDDAADCLYFYGRNQAPLATSHCAANIRTNADVYGSWSNAGYVALDNGDFSSAVSYFAKASNLFYVYIVR